MKVLITGSNGFIAKNIKHLLDNSYSVDSISRQDFDLLDTNKVNEFFSLNFLSLKDFTKEALLRVKLDF